MVKIGKTGIGKTGEVPQRKTGTKSESKVEGTRSTGYEINDELREVHKAETILEEERKELERQKNALEEKFDALRMKVLGESLTSRTTLQPATGSYLNRAFSAILKTKRLKNANTPALHPVSKPESAMTAMEKMEAAKEGITKKEFEQLKETTGLDYDQLAHVLDVARTTLVSKKGNERFSQGLSEKIMSLADIYSYGYEIFGDQQEFNQWIFQPIPALGGKAPYAFLDSHYGREEVRNIIGRIAYGVYS